MMRALAFVLGAWLVGIAPALAHKPSDSYLTIEATDSTVDVRWDIALRDLHMVLGLDADGDGNLTWGEVRGARPLIESYALARLDLATGGRRCALRPAGFAIDDHTDGAYAVLSIATDCTASVPSIEVGYRLLFEVDSQHRGLARLESATGTQAAVFAPDATRQVFDLARPRMVDQAIDYAREGIWHIWIGYDHVLFLITLLLPVALVRAGGGWRKVERFQASLAHAATIVTAFTVSHSLTLSLAAVGMVALPSRLVESAIAATVILVAINNVVPLVTRRLWLVAFGFGLIHGLGFASVLTDLGFAGGALVIPLVGFNLGVEIGQMAIVAAILPLIFVVRHSKAYRRVALPLGSLGVAGLAALWFAARAFDANLLP